MEKKGKRIEAELQLPEAIIQHIQSFMSGKAAAQTTILSKSWYAAWLTRPNLDFDQRYFERACDYDTQGSEGRFWKFARKTVRRYEKANLKIDGLRLWIHGSNDAKHYTYSLANKLIMQALKMGATDLAFKIHDPDWAFTFPHQVFGYESLTRLAVSGCKICVGAHEKISCWSLKSLTLIDVSVEGDIISSCPLIENLSLSSSYLGSLFDQPVILDEFQKLKRLLLYEANVHPLYFNDFSSKFPCLKEFALNLCNGFNILEISSPSLERIKFTHEKEKVFRAKFDVPNIRKFTYSGSNIPSLSFKTTASSWESEISIKRHRYHPSVQWFLELNKLLKKLCQSKVSLSLDVLSEKSLDWATDIKGLSKPVVENLTINVPCSVCPAFFYALFRSCRPIYISQYWFPKSYKGGKKTHDFMDFVFKRMMPQVTLNSCIAYQTMSGESDLKEVLVEFYDESVSAWRPRLCDASKSLGADEQRIRVHLRWRR